MRKIDIEAERIYENSKVQGSYARSAQSKYYWATEPLINEFDEKTFIEIKNKDTLEIGCSSGEKAKLYVKYSSNYTGIDLSDSGIEKARRRSLSNAEFLTCDAHKLPFKDKSYDVVIVNSLLHHLDLKIALSEINRVLRVDGIICAREPLGANPIFNLYRNFTPASRTVDERPFTLQDLRLLEEIFNKKDIKFFGFLSIASAYLRFKNVRALLTIIDNLISATPLKYAFWQFYGFYCKK